MEEGLEEKATWKCEEQAIIGNIGLERLTMNDNGEEKHFIGVSKFDKIKNVLFPVEDAEMIGRKLIEMARA